jgi:hypothetical protein
VRALYVPIFCEIIGKISRPLDFTHSGLGFIDEKTGEEFTIEYNINPVNYTPVVINAIRPVATYNKTTKLYDFEWKFQVRTYMQDYIKTSECGWEK